MSRRPSTYKYKTGGFFALAALVVLTAAVFSASFFLPTVFPTEYSLGDVNKLAGKPAEPAKPVFVVTHLPTPSPLRGIYMTQCVVGTKDFRADLVKIADTTEINAIVIDIKDYSGRIGFLTENPLLKPAISETCRAGDMKEFIGSLHDKNIYVIGRITVFQDPFMTTRHPERAIHKLSDGSVWKDYKGLSFIDVGSKEHWDYIVALSKESYAIGFDELNFDYIRYPSDGNMKDVAFKIAAGKTKPEMLKEFFAYLSRELEPAGVVLSADLFGLTTTSNNDLNIGQVLENAFPYFDYIAPMVYPSHYPPHFNGWNDPNKYPYEVVKFAMDNAVSRAKIFDALQASTTPGYSGNSVVKLRPWLQDFDYGGNYDVAEVRVQIKATYDAGLDSWMLWSPSNRYTLGALEK